MEKVKHKIEEDQAFQKGLEGGVESKILGPVLFFLYGACPSNFIRKWIFKILYKIENKYVYSITLRKILYHYYGVSIGMYTHGSCFVAGNFDRYTTVGRYCSIAADIHVFNRDHPLDFKSTHAFFFNPSLKYTKIDLVKYTPLKIGNDVWIGYGVIILPGVTEIGTGAVIGAGSVVSRNIPPYAVAVGHPVRIVRYRFSKEIIDRLLKEKWWEKNIQEIDKNKVEYNQAYEAYLTSQNPIEKKNDKSAV